VVRTEAHARRVLVHRAILNRLLHHVREPALPLPSSHIIHEFRWIYSSTAAYIVDANPGRSSAAVAMNSCFRGVAAFVFTEAAVPLQESLGDGGLYTLWAGILVLCELVILPGKVARGRVAGGCGRTREAPELETHRRG
jgi:hypothetical protein